MPTNFPNPQTELPPEKQPVRGASMGTVANYNRMVTTFPTTGGSGQVAGAGSGRTFTADGALNKTGLLLMVAFATGTVAYVADLPVGVAWVGMLVALGLGLWCSFQPRRAAVLAPIYAVLEGAVLGVISHFYANSGRPVVTLAIVGTACIVSGVWAVNRSGLVRITPKFFQITLVSSVAMLVVMAVALLTGWGATGLGGVLVFGVLYLILAVMNLFVDFSFIDRAQQIGLDADAEWYAAFSLMVSSVMVYLALLRIFGGRR